MREGKPCEGAKENLKYLLGFPTHQINLNTLEVLAEGMVQDHDMNFNQEMICNEEEMDPFDY